jgi:STE24 endopeptidase
MDVTIDAQRQEKARRYATTKRALFVAELILGAAYLVALIASGGAVWLAGALAAVPFQRAGLVAAYFLALFVGYTVLSLPFSVVGGWWLPRRYGLSVQTFGGWLADWLKGNAIGLLLGLVSIEVVFWLLLVLPQLWWLVAGILYLALVVGLANLGPVLLLPLFFKLTRLEPSPLTERLEDLSRRAGARVRGVYRMDLSAKTTAANAALMGLGNTRRIVLGDTLLDRYTSREIEVIFAHELGHHVHHDVPRLVIGQSIVTLVGLFVSALVLARESSALGYQGIADVAAMPLLALVLSAFGVVTTPILNYLSRRQERAADLYAIRATGDSEAFVDAMTRLANQNLAELDPARWVEVLLYDHPSIGERIRLGRRFQAERRTG